MLACSGQPAYVYTLTVCPLSPDFRRPQAQFGAVLQQRGLLSEAHVFLELQALGTYLLWKEPAKTLSDLGSGGHKECSRGTGGQGDEEK